MGRLPARPKARVRKRRSRGTFCAFRTGGNLGWWMSVQLRTLFRAFSLMATCKKFVWAACIFALAACCSRAQTIRVDAKPEHAANSIIPTRALGAGIDRLPYGAADKLF